MTLAVHVKLVDGSSWPFVPCPREFVRQNTEQLTSTIWLVPFSVPNTQYTVTTLIWKTRKIALFFSSVPSFSPDNWKVLWSSVIIMKEIFHSVSRFESFLLPLFLFCRQSAGRMFTNALKEKRNQFFFLFYWGTWPGRPEFAQPNKISLSTSAWRCVGSWL